MSPSRRTNERAKLWWDVAAMLESLLRLMDSSPLGPINWLFVVVWILDGKNVFFVGSAAIALRSLDAEAALADADSAQECIDTSWQCNSVIDGAMQRHIFPPTVSAQRRSKMKHCFYNICHSIRCETSTWADASKLLASCLQCALDGAERKVRRCKLHSTVLFSWWHEDGPADDGMDLYNEPVGACLDATNSFTFHGLFHWLKLCFSKL